MATLILSAVGTALGGPLGGALGGLVGNQIDRAVFRPGPRTGPRLRELAVTSSTYGSAVPRHYGRVRVPGTIIWATDIVETTERGGGGKGRPATTSFSYSASFAVALSSRPVAALGRIWADGNLLRGAGGDLKTGGTVRFYQGHADQLPDPLIAAAEGEQCPAFRGLAYCVFENLHLGDFGNRIPALSFELFADGGEVGLSMLVEELGEGVDAPRVLPGLAGFSLEGGPIAESLAGIGLLYPFASEASAQGLRLFAPDAALPLPTLPEPVAAMGDDAGDLPGGKGRDRSKAREQSVGGVRYYDLDRDYQVGIQRPAGRPASGDPAIVDFPGVMSASAAAGLVHDLALARDDVDRLVWRIGAIDPRFFPGRVVLCPGEAGQWLVEEWELSDAGITLKLRRVPARRVGEVSAEPGRSNPPPDRIIPPSVLYAFEIAPEAPGPADARVVHAALSAASPGWPGAMLYADRMGALIPLEPSGPQRAVVGTLLEPLPAANPLLIDRGAAIAVELLAEDMVLAGQTLESLAQGSNRALVGSEIVQFAAATRIDARRWQLEMLLRGRLGTERAALQGQPAGQRFVLLDERVRKLTASELELASRLGAIGLADAEPVMADIALAGSSRAPLCPVHPRAQLAADGALLLGWTRRARGAWMWQASVEPALGEQSERYEIGLGPVIAPLLAWEVDQPRLRIEAAQWAELSAQLAGQPLWVRQVGTHARSPALLLKTV